MTLPIGNQKLLDDKGNGFEAFSNAVLLSLYKILEESDTKKEVETILKNRGLSWEIEEIF